jgi:hypothetical protein
MFSFYHRYPILIFFLIHHFIMKTSHKSDELKKKRGVHKSGTYGFYSSCLYQVRAIAVFSFPVVDWFCLFVDLWVLPFPLEECSVFGNFVITLILYSVLSVGRNWNKVTIKTFSHSPYFPIFVCLNHQSNTMYDIIACTRRKCNFTEK